MSRLHSIGLLYSYRRCPYAIRARVMLNLSQLVFDVYEVDLKNKPESMLALSPKGTVPVLQLNDGRVLDESVDIVRFAEQAQRPAGWRALSKEEEHRGEQILDALNQAIIPATNQLRWPERFPGMQDEAVSNLQITLKQLSINNGSLLGHTSIYDVIVFPTIRQLYRIAPELIQADPVLEQWLVSWVSSSAFKRAMQKSNEA